MKRLALSVLCLALLAACESTGGYRPPPIGASDQEVEPGRYRVIFRGLPRASAAEVHDRALLHAAELTLARGYDWFRIVERFDDVAPPTGPRFTLGIGGASFGRHSAVGVSGARSFGGEGTLVSVLEIVAGRGDRPGSPDVYDARAVSDTIRRRLS
jgi:hypothetical protein